MGRVLVGNNWQLELLKSGPILTASVSTSKSIVDDIGFDIAYGHETDVGAGSAFVVDRVDVLITHRDLDISKNLGFMGAEAMEWVVLSTRVIWVLEI